MIDCAVFPATFLCNSVSVGRRWIRVCQDSFACCPCSFTRKSSSCLGDVTGSAEEKDTPNQMICLPPRFDVQRLKRDRRVPQQCRSINSIDITAGVLTTDNCKHTRARTPGTKYQHRYDVWSTAANGSLESSPPLGETRKEIGCQIASSHIILGSFLSEKVFSKNSKVWK